MIVNLTASRIVLLIGGREFGIEPEHVRPRIEKRRTLMGKVLHATTEVPVYYDWPVVLHDVPPPIEGVWYVVQPELAMACPEREDFLVPDADDYNHLLRPTFDPLFVEQSNSGMVGLGGLWKVEVKRFWLTFVGVLRKLRRTNARRAMLVVALVLTALYVTGPSGRFRWDDQVLTGFTGTSLHDVHEIGLTLTTPRVRLFFFDFANGKYRGFIACNPSAPVQSCLSN